MFGIFRALKSRRLKKPTEDVKKSDHSEDSQLDWGADIYLLYLKPINII